MVEQIRRKQTAAQDIQQEVLPDHVQQLLDEENSKDAELQDLVDKLQSFDANSPDLTTLKHWESKYGKVYLSKIHEDEPKFYLWRCLLRLEWKELLGLNLNDDYLRQESIVKKCLLYPTPSHDFIYTTGAGTLPTLEKQIMYKSGFVSTDEALSRISVIV